MMNEMMKECCGEGGMPDFEKMKAFMEKVRQGTIYRGRHQEDAAVLPPHREAGSREDEATHGKVWLSALVRTGD